MIEDMVALGKVVLGVMALDNVTELMAQLHTCDYHIDGDALEALRILLDRYTQM